MTLWASAAGAATMKKFKSVADIPPGCLVAPTAYFTPRPGKKPLGSFEDSIYFRRSDVSELLTADDWKGQGRTIKAREQPIGHRGRIDPVGVFADWQTE
jgi:hypothetical protein